MITRWVTATALALVLCTAIGCSQEKVNEMLEQGKKALNDGASNVAQSVEQAKTAVNETTTAAKEKLQLSGKMDLTIGSPVATSACYARFIPAQDERPSVLQLQSYKDASTETFPSIFMRGTTNAATAAELVGQSIPVQFYGQQQAGGPVWSSVTESPTMFKILTASDELLTGEFVESSLQRTDQAAAIPLTGTVASVWLKP